MTINLWIVSGKEVICSIEYKQQKLQKGGNKVSKEVKSFVFMVVAFLLILSIASSCASSPPSEVIHWRFHTTVTPDNDMGKVDQMFADKVAEDTNGRLMIDILWAGASGIKPPDLIDAASNRLIESFDQNPSVYPAQLGAWVAMCDISDFILSNPQQAVEIEKNSHTMYEEALKKNNIKLLAVLSPGIYNDVYVLFSKLEIKSIEDFKGMRMRIFSVLEKNFIWEPFGVQCLSMPISDTYVALKTGLCDATPSLPHMLLSIKLDEVCPYAYVICYTNGFVASTLACNQDAFDALPSDLQDKLLKTSREFETSYWDEIFWNPEKYGLRTGLSAIKEAEEKGMVVRTIPDDILSKIQAGAKAGLAEYAKQSGPDAEKFLAIMLAAIEKYPEPSHPVWDYVQENSK
jgi:TRAP-type C4-dicarboxylate transport system substrate-binding protein